MGEDLSSIQLFSYLMQNYEYIETIDYPFIEFKKREDVTNSEILQTVYGEFLKIDENSIKIYFE